MENDQQSVVARWNELMLEAIRDGGASPTPTSYRLYLTHAAIFDAWAAYDDDAYGVYSEIVRPAAEQTEANKIEAVSYAAYRALSDFFPEAQASFDAFMDELGFDVAVADADPSMAAGVGNLAAAEMFAARAEDGSNAENGFADTTGYVAVNSADPNADSAPGGDAFDPNRWQPLRVPNGTAVDENGNPVATDDPATFDDQQALTPHWASVTPFALPSGDALRPPAPPQLGDMDPYTDGAGVETTGDQAYRDQFTEVLEISATLTDEEKVIAEFWADGPRTEAPPGHWNQIAQDISTREGYGVDDDAKMFFLMNAAIFDSGIATWEAKYAYDYVRPQSAIRELYFGEEVEAWAGPNLGTQTILGQDWQPYQDTTFVTPPFPEFTSGHSGFSRAAAETLGHYTGTDAFYDGVTLGNYDLNGDGEIDLLGEFIATDLLFEDYDGPPIPLRWDTLTDAADEAGISRLFGGIHIQDGDLRGREIGEGAAEFAIERAEAHFTRGGDDALKALAAGGLLLAGAGDDAVVGSVSADAIEAGSGDDDVRGGGGGDEISGEDGADTLRGAGDDDAIDGGAGDDVVFGGDGDDVLTGGAGDDQMNGNAGMDTLSGDAGDDQLRGGLGDDDLAGGEGLDTLFGGTGDDTLDGGAEDDALFGNLGADALSGGDGDDRLNGGLGDDMLEGGAGTDTFEFLGAFGDDVVSDFVIGEDQIALAAGREVEASEVGGATVLTVGDASVTLSDLLAADEITDSIFFI